MRKTCHDEPSPLPTTAPKVNPTSTKHRLPPAPSSTPVPRPSLPFPSDHPISEITPLSSMHSPHEELIRSIQGKQHTESSQKQPQSPLEHHATSTNKNRATPKTLAATLGDLPPGGSKTHRVDIPYTTLKPCTVRQAICHLEVDLKLRVDLLYTPKPCTVRQAICRLEVDLKLGHHPPATVGTAGVG